jgi:hypothetical protein
MSEPTDVELEDRLSELERDLGPTLRHVYRTNGVQPGFDAQATVRSVSSKLSASSPRRPPLRIIHPRAWATLAATLVGVLVVGGALLATRPQSVNAADVLEQLQTEAYGAMVETAGPCPGPGGPHAAGGTLAIQTGGSDAGHVAMTNTSANANDLSEQLARALGVSGDRVRQAMIATVKADLAAVPPEPMTAIAQRLGKTPADVCAAFFDARASTGEHGVVAGFSSSVSTGRPEQRAEAALNLGGRVINLNSASAEELREPAQRLGISPEQLLAAVRAAFPSTPQPPPPSPDEIIQRLASNLGMSEDQVRTAIKQVQGNSGFYFVVPLPALGR